MPESNPADLLTEATNWWSTDIIDMKPGVIRFRGFSIEQLIGSVSFPQMIWLLLRGDLPSPDHAALLEAALVAAVDHGPQAPSIAVGRMSITCGLPLNGAMASAINLLDDVHGGAGQQCMELYADIARRMSEGTALVAATQAGIAAFVEAHGKILPGSAIAFTRSTLAHRGSCRWSMLLVSAA
ncbi:MULTISPECIES: citrate/2-methylcitrate synthase [Bradyrhizobium]|uniref:Citrate synthase n=1 Tax=Bradyrhizobium vignae TaxID=1549949 RepID=A0A2U3PU94_9BRAD